MPLPTNLDNWAPHALGLTRIMAGLLLLAHGTSKLLGFPAGGFSPDAGSLPWIAGCIELLCGTLLTLGLFTRPAAFLASGLCAFAYFIGHFPQSFFPVLNGGDAAVLFCFIFFYLVFSGPGLWSLDAVRARAQGAG